MTYSIGQTLAYIGLMSVYFFNGFILLKEAGLVVRAPLDAVGIHLDHTTCPNLHT
jgi:hypothetical protein